MGVGAHAVTTSVIPQWDQELLFKILGNIHDVVLVLDSNTTIVYANEAYAKILGTPVDKVLGRRLDSIEPKATAIEVLRTGIPRTGKSYLHSVGIHVVGNTFPLMNGNKIIGSVSVFKNISDVIELNLALQRSQGVADYLKEQLEQREQLPLSFKEYVGQNPRLKDILLLAAKVAKTDSTVLIRGESGVGKEVLARAIHNCSRRKDRPLIKVNCAAIPEALLESELFGFEEGAFTGAKKGGKLGKFELAHSGTIFLDEIGDMSLTMQAKLLRVLQEKEFEKVGGTKSIAVDIRVIAATNRDLEDMIEKGTFRLDLFYRLNIVPLNLPPLRDRKDDIVVLANKFLEQYSREAGHELILSAQVMRAFQDYDWPGNIRELQNVLEHASIVNNGTQIELQHLPSSVVSTMDDRLPEKEKPFDVKETVSRVEKEMIISALAAYNNNRTSTMKALGMSRRTFYDKLRRYGIAD